MKSPGSEGERKGVRGVLVVVGVANVTYIIACKSLSCVQTVVMSRTNRSFLEDHAYSISWHSMWDIVSCLDLTFMCHYVKLVFLICSFGLIYLGVYCYSCNGKKLQPLEFLRERNYWTHFWELVCEPRDYFVSNTLDIGEIGFFSGILEKYYLCSDLNARQWFLKKSHFSLDISKSA